MNDVVTTTGRQIEEYQPLTAKEIREQVQLIQEVMAEVMHDGEHYGVIPGTERKNRDGKDISKKTLLKPGAEKLCLTFRLDPQYEITEKYDGHHLTIISKCILYRITTGNRLGSGMGSCSTKETKYAYRHAARRCPTCGKEAIIKGKQEYGGGWVCFKAKEGCGAKFPDDDSKITSQPIGRLPNEDVADQYNTILKMANKRSLVAGVLNVTAASDIFTQDLEDEMEQPAPVASQTPKASATKPPIATPTAPTKSDWREITLKRAGKCVQCTAVIAAGARALYSSINGTVKCMACPSDAELIDTTSDVEFPESA